MGNEVVSGGLDFYLAPGLPRRILGEASGLKSGAQGVNREQGTHSGGVLSATGRERDNLKNETRAGDVAQGVEHLPSLRAFRVPSPAPHKSMR